MMLLTEKITHGTDVSARHRPERMEHSYLVRQHEHRQQLLAAIRRGNGFKARMRRRFLRWVSKYGYYM